MGKKIFPIKLADETGEITLKFFGEKFTYKVNDVIDIQAAKVNEWENTKSLINKYRTTITLLPNDTLVPLINDELKSTSGEIDFVSFKSNISCPKCYCSLLEEQCAGATIKCSKCTSRFRRDKLIKKNIFEIFVEGTKFEVSHDIMTEFSGETDPNDIEEFVLSCDGVHIFVNNNQCVEKIRSYE